MAVIRWCWFPDDYFFTDNTILRGHDDDYRSGNHPTGIRPYQYWQNCRKGRQAASHPEWIRSNVPNTNNARILPVLVTPVTTAKSGATPHLKKVSYWGLSEFREWAELVLQVIRELRREFSEPGDLDWRAKAAEELCKIHADASGLYNWLYERTADKFLQEVQ